MAIIFLDLADAIGRLTGVVEGDHMRLRLEPFPGVLEWLARQAAAGERFGSVWSGPSDGPVRRLIQETGLATYIDARLILAREVFDVALFRDAVEAAGAAASECMWVSSDLKSRLLARAAGMRVSPHRALVAPILAGEVTRFM